MIMDLLGAPRFLFIMKAKYMNRLSKRGGHFFVGFVGDLMFLFYADSLL